MSQSVDELIGKIREEGVEAGREKAGKIEADAREQAARVVAEAEAQAAKIIAGAEAQRKKSEQAAQAALQQAARDTLISLKQELTAQLSRILRKDIRAALDAGRMADLITKLVSGFVADNGELKGVEVVLDAETLQLLEEDLLAKLQKSVKGGITLRTEEDLGGGFTISYDAGRSAFDFSEEALARYIARYLNPRFAKLLEDA